MEVEKDVIKVIKRPFITTESGNGKYQVVIKVHSLEALHEAYDRVLKVFSNVK